MGAIAASSGPLSRGLKMQRALVDNRSIRYTGPPVQGAIRTGGAFVGAPHGRDRRKLRASIAGSQKCSVRSSITARSDIPARPCRGDSYWWCFCRSAPWARLPQAPGLYRGVSKMQHALGPICRARSCRSCGHHRRLLQERIPAPFLHKKPRNTSG